MEILHIRLDITLMAIFMMFVNEITYLVLKIYRRKETDVGRFINVRNRLIAYEAWRNVYNSEREKVRLL